MTDPLLQRLYRLFAVFSDNERYISPEQAHFIIGKLFRLALVNFDLAFRVTYLVQLNYLVWISGRLVYFLLTSNLLFLTFLQELLCDIFYINMSGRYPCVSFSSTTKSHLTP